MPSRVRARRVKANRSTVTDHGTAPEVPDAHFAVSVVRVGPPARLVSSDLVATGDGAAVVDAYTEAGRRCLLRAEPGEALPVAGFRGGPAGVRAGALLRPGELVLVGDGAAHRVDLDALQAERVSIPRLPPRISHLHALTASTLLVSPLFADTVAVVSLDERAVVRQFRSPAHEVVRCEKDSVWLVNASRGRTGRFRLSDFESETQGDFPVGATPVDDGSEVFSLPGTPYQTGRIGRASFVQIRPSGRIQACRVDGSDGRDGEGAPGLDCLLGTDGYGRLVGLAGSSVVLLDRSTLSPVARLPLLVRRLRSAAMVGPSALALLQPLPPLIHFVSW